MYGTEIIRYNLIRDFTDLDPNSFVSSYPGVFAASGDVPAYEYKSLKSLWLGTAAASGDLADQIVAHSGSAKEGPKGGIVILLESFYPGYSPNIPHAMKDDATGACQAIVRIIVYKPRFNSPANTISDTATRICMILDQYHRNQRRLKPAQIPIVGDNSISQDYFKCFLIEAQGPGSLQRVSDSAIELVFRVEFKKIIL